MGNFALELKDGETVDIVKVNDKTFRADIYDANGDGKIGIEINSDIFIEWVLSGVC